MNITSGENSLLPWRHDNASLIPLILLCLLLAFAKSGMSQPPPPSLAEIIVTDSAAPAADLDITFRSIRANNTSDRIVTIRNSGEESLEIGNIAQENQLAAPFSIVTDTDSCSGQSIDPSGSCSLTVRFSPTAVGTFTNDFDIPSNDADENSVTISVSGTGIASASNNPPSVPLQISPANGQTNAATTVEFKWEESTDSDGEAVTYDLYVCTDENFTVGCVPEGENIASLGLNKSVYYAGLGGYGASLFLAGLASAFVGGRWRRRKIALIALTCMTVLIFASCGGGGGGGGSDTTVPSDTINEATHTSSGLSGATTYYWKVVARDATGEETSSSIRNFNTL